MPTSDPHHPLGNKSRTSAIRACEYWKQLKSKGAPLCPEWENDFDRYYSDTGNRPYDSFLDRLDSKLPHSPDNSRWMPINTHNKHKEMK